MATILITDDEANIVSGLKYAFEDEGFSVLTAGNGLEAWHEINTNSVDLVITDLRMPEMDGYELIKKISASYPTLPVIVLTGHGTIETAVETMRDGAIDFFTKPVDLDKLIYPLVLRHWSTGDWFCPLGMKRSRKKLSDFFTDLKFSAKQKKECLILQSDKDIVWVVGHRLDDRYKITPRTRRALKITVTAK